MILVNILVIHKKHNKGCNVLYLNMFDQTQYLCGHIWKIIILRRYSHTIDIVIQLIYALAMESNGIHS